MQRRVLFQGDRDRHRHPDPGRRGLVRPLTLDALVKLNKIYTRTGDGGAPAWSTAAGSAKSSHVRMTGDRRRRRSQCRDRRGASRRSKTAWRAPCSARSRTNCSTSAPTSRRPARWSSGGAARRRPRRSSGSSARSTRMNAALEPLASFILPGGIGGVSALHLARAIVRRAERSAVALPRARPLNPLAARLSQPPVGPSVRRRPLRRQGQGGEVLWRPGATRLARAQSAGAAVLAPSHPLPEKDRGAYRNRHQLHAQGQRRRTLVDRQDDRPDRRRAAKAEGRGRRDDPHRRSRHPPRRDLGRGRRRRNGPMSAAASSPPTS